MHSLQSVALRRLFHNHSIRSAASVVSTIHSISPSFPTHQSHHSSHHVNVTCPKAIQSVLPLFIPPSPAIVTPQQQPKPACQDEILSKTFYRRDLPKCLTEFTSTEGRRLFKESLAAGHAEIYFSLSGNFTHQSEPAFCGLGSLAMVLNALAVDPRKRWKGVWRWYADDMLEGSSNLETIREKGMTFDEFACLAECNGLKVEAKRFDRITKAEFLDDLKLSTSSTDVHMVLSFSRKTLSQTGDGHFSPIGAYHPEKNMVLVLDVARFKYPSYFASVDQLYEAMRAVDKETRLPRGYFMLRRGERNSIGLCTIPTSQNPDWSAIDGFFFDQLPQYFGTWSRRLNVDEARDRLPDAIDTILHGIPDQKLLVTLRGAGIDLVGSPKDSGSHPSSSPSATELAEEYSKDIRLLNQQTQANPLFRYVCEAVRACADLRERFRLSPRHPEQLDEQKLVMATIFLLSIPDQVFMTLPAAVHQLVAQARDRSAMGSLLKDEVAQIAQMLESLLRAQHCKCGKLKSSCRTK
ncbi:Phytochelatin synthase-domain-containing protein [Polychytrium aggregatum]|uniref:Phytochelatin synthase-domain-containing protein n=1 Tax=Polychytrium aggregatum TaxID=110093 RepID=UPI0022FE6316|nr:Phytochelatin synthase-domain-containing protein [Polychytrium aggregatum]KAI9202248.1 Phytochelatin synthase-domain-containing protein [Polychytrium aggregatum]